MKNNCVMLSLLVFLTACQQADSDSQSTQASTQAVPEKPVKQQVSNPSNPVVEVSAEGQKDDVLQAPFEFSYPDLNDKEVKLSDYRGKWVIVNYWATWCPPCRKEMPDFVKFKEKFAEKVEIIGIDNEDADNEVIKKFVEEYNINYPIVRADVYNPTDFDRENTMGLPTTIVFNPGGYQVSKRVGPVHYDDLLELVGFAP